jgi:hypothetical protein
VTQDAVNCHHNYVSREKHFGKDVYLTRKGAVSAKAGELGIIPGSMGAKSFIVRGKGNPDSFCTCSHGAGRAMSRTEAKRRFTIADHVAATAGVECRKDAGVIDETPMAYKDIDAVMAAQADLVDIVHTAARKWCASKASGRRPVARPGGVSRWGAGRAGRWRRRPKPRWTTRPRRSGTSSWLLSPCRRAAALAASSRHVVYGRRRLSRD